MKNKMIKSTIANLEKREMGNVSCLVIDSFSHIDQALEKEWDELVIETRGSIYLTCAWSRIWWEFYGNEQPLRIFFYRCKGKLVGAIPIYIGEIRIGLIKTLVARLVGAYHPPRLFNLPIIKEYAASVGEHLVRHLIETDRCDLISIGLVSDECEAKKVLFDAAAKMTDYLGMAREIPFGVKTHFDLPDTYDAYLKTLSGSERRKRKYYEKLLNEEYDVVLVEMREPDKIEAEMPKFMALHKENWRQQGKLGYFDAWPKSEAFNRRLAVKLADLGRTRLIKIATGEMPIIYQYCYVFGDFCYWELPARAAGEEWDRFRLGATAVVILIRRTIEEGIKRIESGLSHYDYKTRLGAKESSVFVLRLIARRPSSIAKYHLCRAFYKFYLNFYYKLWYSRVQPKLPSVFCRPIWMTYIRMIL